MVKTFHLFLFLIPLSSCGVFVAEDEEFTFQRMPYNGREFRVDGYYFNRFPSDSNGVSVERVHVLFFYRNGLTLSGHSPTVSELPDWEEKFRNGQYYQDRKDNQTDWGIFKLDTNGMILRERLVNPNGTLLVYRDRIKIVNDAILEFQSSERIDGSKFRKESLLYQFKAFAPKPDSIVDFIP